MNSPLMRNSSRMSMPHNNQVLHTLYNNITSALIGVKYLHFCSHDVVDVGHHLDQKCQGHTCYIVRPN